MAFLFNSTAERARVFAAAFARELPELAFVTDVDRVAPEQVRYLLTWAPPADVARFPQLELLFSIGAGVDQFPLALVPERVGLVRMVEDGIVRTVVEYVVLAVLALHRDLPGYLAQQRLGEWRPRAVRPATARRVGLLGLGVLGRAVLAQLAPFGFALSGWSRSAHAIEGVECCCGEAALLPMVARCDILVCLLPLTPQTRGIIGETLLAAMPAGAGLVQVGRGAQLDHGALLRALDGHLGGAVIDVTEPEPLPASHALWRHPKVILTPHVAGSTQAETAAAAVIENIRRHRAGLAPIGLVDRRRCY